MAAAANLAAWHDSLHPRPRFETSTGSWWWTASTPRPWIYFTAIARPAPATAADRRAFELELAVHLDDPTGASRPCASRSTAFGLEGEVARTCALRGRWFTRPPGPVTDDGTRRRRAGDRPGHDRGRPDDYERATCAAFRAPPPVAPFEIHAPGILDDPRMHVLLGPGRRGDRPAGPWPTSPTTCSASTASDVPGHRGRGHATALTPPA